MHTVLKFVGNGQDWSTRGQYENFADAINHMDAITTRHTDNVIVQTTSGKTVAAHTTIAGRSFRRFGKIVKTDCFH